MSEDGRIPFLKKAITWRNRPGRRKKSERDSDSLALAALCKHHGLDGNSVGNFEHATNRGLAAEFNKGKKANELKLSENALSRFLKNKNYALRKYKVACCDKSIGTVLALWRGELPSRLAKLKDDEQDHHDDD